MIRFDASRFRFCAEALSGTGGFRPMVSIDSQGKPVDVGETYLIPYPRESDERFARRNQVAWFIRHLSSACNRFAGYLAKRPPLRNVGDNPLLRTFVDDCDWCGTDLDIAWHQFIIEAKARGSMLLLVDRPQRLPADQAASMEQRVIPYLVPIYPEQVTTYDTNQQGQLERVAISEWLSVDGHLALVEREWNTIGWRVRQGTKIIEEGEHGLGICPVLLFTEAGDFPCYGEYSQIADISRRIFNARSELDELLRGQTFSLLIYKVPESRFPLDLSGVSEALGTSNMLQTLDGGAGFIAPPSSSTDTYLKVIEQMEQQIRDIALIVESTDHGESGAALTLRFQALNANLVGFARRMEDLERRMWDLVCRWLDIENPVEVSWAKDYAIAEVSRELEILSAMQAVAMPDETLRAQQKAVISAQFGAVQNDVLDQLIASVDEAAKEPNQGQGAAA